MLQLNWISSLYPRAIINLANFLSHSPAGKQPVSSKTVLTLYFSINRPISSTKSSGVLALKVGYRVGQEQKVHPPFFLHQQSRPSHCVGARSYLKVAVAFAVKPPFRQITINIWQIVQIMVQLKLTRIS